MNLGIVKSDFITLFDELLVLHEQYYQKLDIECSDIKELKDNFYVCDNCNFHLNMPVENRLDHIYGEKKYEELLKKNGFPKITTEIQNFKNFYYAEEYHQQYLLKNPNGYCGVGGCNVSYNN